MCRCCEGYIPEVIVFDQCPYIVADLMTMKSEDEVLYIGNSVSGSLSCPN